MSNLDKVSERNRVTKLGIDAMITNYLRLERENVALRDELKDCSAVVDRQQEALDRNTEQLASKQAQIDALMFEYCPIEMTEEQVEEWKKHQVVSALLKRALWQEVKIQKAKAEKHYKLGTEYFDLYTKAEREIAGLRDVLSRLIKVHDAMGGKCGTVRIAAEEALLGKAQSEYICTCGIRVTPHKCPTNNGF